MGLLWCRYVPEETLGRSIADIINEKYRQQAAHNMERRRAGVPEQSSFRFRHKGGSGVTLL